MRAWRRATRPERCGSDDGCWIPEGDPYLELKGEGWTKVRCVRHAGHPPPDRIDEPEVYRQPAGFTGTQQLAKTVRMGPKMLTFDHKAKQAKNDDD